MQQMHDHTPCYGGSGVPDFSRSVRPDGKVYLVGCDRVNIDLRRTNDFNHQVRL
ncbi:MAG: hypothetical protein GDA43_00330 [Hormoscilla sp. SP5CHS1]|nr:hypothetical protein [Hormoscilla sp. SP12CHS1]MBC6451820.1 hypothetical protein [Hormoscilla sp. SP5CHS1]